ncbi:hypothetical protein TNCV_1316411 [Trichonephila clavipes]|uniref:Uncharacterized protein n=2 Tax=Trichonephila TaxID=2585208 RepID=A0A8X6WXA7_9ARAC|nr:hypothetical protein TNCV_1316411 [Trichonephila clavipes]GFY41826.1 hypothetical protein TNIN_262561 [Trichonephila inaurata madagascariensis]
MHIHVKFRTSLQKIRMGKQPQIFCNFFCRPSINCHFIVPDHSSEREKIVAEVQFSRALSFRFPARPIGPTGARDFHAKCSKKKRLPKENTTWPSSEAIFQTSIVTMETCARMPPERKK